MKRSVARTIFKTEWVPGRVPLENCLCYSLDPKELPIQMAEEEGTMYSGNLVCSKLCKAAFSGSRCLLARSGAAGRSTKPACLLLDPRPPETASRRQDSTGRAPSGASASQGLGRRAQTEMARPAEAPSPPCLLLDPRPPETASPSGASASQGLGRRAQTL